MIVARSIAKNVSIQLIGRIIGTIFGLMTIALITRYLGPEGFGQFTTATSYLQFVGVLVDFGLTITVVQMLSEPGADEERIMGNMVSLRIITAVCVFTVAPVAALMIGWGAVVHRGIAIGALSFVLLALHQIFVGLFQRRLRMELSSLAEVLGRGVLLLATWVAIRSHAGVPALIGALVVGNLVMTAVSWAFARRLQSFHLRLERSMVALILRRSWPMALSIIFNLIYLRGDMIILSLTRGQAEVGLYGAAYKPLDVITVVPMLFMGLVLPLMVAAWSAQNRERFNHLLQRSADMVSILAFGVLAGGTALATPLMLFLSGKEFASAGPLLALLIVAASCVFYGSLFGHAIVALGKQRVMLWVYAGDAALSIALYLYLIPRYGATAGALITILSEFIIAVGGALIVLRVSKLRFSMRVPVRAALAAGIMAFVLIMLPDVQVFIRILIGTVLYGILLVLFRALSREDVAAILQRRTPAV